MGRMTEARGSRIPSPRLLAPYAVERELVASIQSDAETTTRSLPPIPSTITSGSRFVESVVVVEVVKSEMSPRDPL